MDQPGIEIAAVATFVAYTVGVFLLAWFSHRVLAKREFMSEYYLGSRGLGVIAFTLTFGATAASAGSFAGFPSLIYAHGWVLAFWAAGYMVVPICAMGLFGKRLNQIARQSGSITLPDIFRERFGSPALALIPTLLMVLMLSFYLVPQFKLAALILQRLFEGTPQFQDLRTSFSAATGLEADYVISLLTFGVLVVLYTTYGGFRAVVWTDVLQGVVMFAGVIVLLALALSYVGGLGTATEQLAVMTTPRLGDVTFTTAERPEEDIVLANYRWFTAESDEATRLFRLNSKAVIQAGETESKATKVVEITTPEEIETILASHSGEIALPKGVVATFGDMRDYDYGANERGVYVSAPGPVPPSERKPTAQELSGFLPVGMAISFFVFWTLSGTAQPGSMVRLMAFDSAKTLTRSIAGLTFYFSLIYFPLIIIFCCARIIVPGLDQTPDRIMPAVAFELSTWAGAPWLAGILVAVPFAAAMSTVDSFMLIISSSVVRDLYQHHVNPQASQRAVKWLSYACMLVIGVVATLGAVKPPKFMQYLIVFASGGLSVAFLMPMAMALYWRRANVAGTMASMLVGIVSYLGLYVAGFVYHGRATPLIFLDLDPWIWGLAASILAGIVVTRLTPPPPEELVRRFF